MKEGGEIHLFISQRVRDLQEDKETIREISKKLGVDRSTIYRWRDAGYINI